MGKYVPWNTYSKRLDSSQFLDDSLLVRQVSRTDRQGGSCNNRQTDRDPDDQDRQGIEKKSLFTRRGNGDVSEEATNPDCQQPGHDNYQQGSSNAIHDHLEVAGILCILHH